MIGKNEAYKKLILVFSATAIILVIDLGITALFFYFKRQLNIGNMVSTLPILLLFEGALIILFGCLVIMPIGGFTVCGRAPRFYFPPETPRKSSPRGYYAIAVGFVLFVLGWIISFISV